MPFDDTPGSPTANSFLSVARADALAVEHPYATAWIALADNARKQSLLIHSTLRINKVVCPPGTVTNANQALKFPRKDLYNENSYLYDSATIPLPIELATFEYANKLIGTNVNLESAASVQGLKRLKAGSFEAEFSEGQVYKLVQEDVKMHIPDAWLCETQEDEAVFVFQIT